MDFSTLLNIVKLFIANKICCNNNFYKLSTSITQKLYAKKVSLYRLFANCSFQQFPFSFLVAYDWSPKSQVSIFTAWLNNCKQDNEWQIRSITLLVCLFRWIIICDIFRIYKLSWIPPESNSVLSFDKIWVTFSVIGSQFFYNIFWRHNQLTQLIWQRLSWAAINS